MRPKPTLNAAKVAAAAAHPARPGETCRAEPGAWHPVVSASLCEGKGDCVEVCPHSVFEVGRLGDLAFSELSLFGKLKSLIHGRKTALTPALDACQACGLCVVACPEKAIALTRRGDF